MCYTNLYGPDMDFGDRGCTAEVRQNPYQGHKVFIIYLTEHENML